MCEQGNQTRSCALLSLFVKKSGLLWGMREGGREAQEGGKVLELNYIVCVEETGADRQMAVDKCCRGTGRGGSQGVSV